MKVVLVHDWLTGMRGGEKCLEVLCRHFPDARLMTLLHHPGSTSPAIEGMQIETSFLQRAVGNYRYWLPLMPKAVESLRIPSDTDLVVSLSHAVAKGIRTPPGVPHICYCFTPMRYAWHLRQDYFGRGRRGWMPGGNPLAVARNVVLDRLRHWDRAASERVTEFVAISETVARRIAECYGRTSTVIYPPVDTDFFTPADVERDDYYLVVSALVPYKRIDLAVSACRALGRRLVIIGAGPGRKRLERAADGNVTFLGWQSNEVIRDHLRRCRALLFPGHEDFGIVPVEAQACGTPVIAYRRGGATETVLAADEHTTGTGLFFEEQSPTDLAAAMRRFEVEPGMVCARLARQQAEQFTAARYQRELLGYLDQVMCGTRSLAA
jgi:glycosyltransferase involved in cell wall biosynthesis